MFLFITSGGNLGFLFIWVIIQKNFCLTTHYEDNIAKMKSQVILHKKCKIN